VIEPDNNHEAPLHGLRVLIVEDETLVAMLIEDYLVELGCTIACSASRLSKAQDYLGNGEIDAAVLDVNVAGNNIAPVACSLAERKIPFIFASGYGAKGLDPKWHSYPVLQKPFTAMDLRNALLTALENSSG
jgi:CheY-like chemotaxis protein